MKARYKKIKEGHYYHYINDKLYAITSPEYKATMFSLDISGTKVIAKLNLIRKEVK